MNAERDRLRADARRARRPVGFARWLGAAVLAAALALVPTAAEAFCGFYVGGGGAELFNNATQVVLMRQGTRTVLSMQNNYQGPPADFAMVVPVPVVLQKDNVKILPADVFTRVEGMSAPRLVEYWEQDPCQPEQDYEMGPMGAPSVAMAGAAEDDSASSYHVKVEARFEVGEYQVVILSASDSTGLDHYLHDQGYKVPKGAEPLLRPYVEGGWKFFVAKVDPKKVTFTNGMATLSPLRFHYDTDEFTLPIRLGLANSHGTQDLIVNILAPGQRYEVANYPNVTIPTNLDVKDEAKTRFGEFYAALFDRTLAKNPHAVVTEYAWDASSCDPCPGPVLDDGDFATLGADVLGEGGVDYSGGGFVLTRLHARYGKGDLKDDLVFKAAPPIVGGREFLQDNGKLEVGARPDSTHNFQGRYAIRHEWTGAIACSDPQRGRWGGPPGGEAPQPIAATGLAFVPRGKIDLPMVVAHDVPEIGLVASDKPTLPSVNKAQYPGCTCQSTGGAAAATSGVLVALGVLVVVRRRKRT